MKAICAAALARKQIPSPKASSLFFHFFLFFLYIQLLNLARVES
jgi:hypothetical protein